MKRPIVQVTGVRVARPRVLDAVIGAGLLAVFLGASFALDGGVGAVDAVAAVVACLAMAWRTQVPVAVLAVAFAAFVGATLVTGDLAFAFLPALIALATCVARAPSLIWAIGWGAAGTVASALTFVALQDGQGDGDLLAVVLWAAIAAAIGVAAHLYRRAVGIERDRAAHAEEARDALALSRVAQERLRIARELHDAVGHHVAAMTMQAGLAEHLMRADPDGAERAIGRVQEAGARVLDELPVLLRTLRQDEADAMPPPSLADIDGLWVWARDAGLDVEVEAPGADRLATLPVTTGVTGFRVLQEALTNAVRHGDGAARVRLEIHGGTLTLRVANRIGTAGAASSGFGLIGMRERVAAAGGSLAARPDGDDFVVEATLPLGHKATEGAR